MKLSGSVLTSGTLSGQPRGFKETYANHHQMLLVGTCYSRDAAFIPCFTLILHVGDNIGTKLQYQTPSLRALENINHFKQIIYRTTLETLVGRSKLEKGSRVSYVNLARPHCTSANLASAVPASNHVYKGLVQTIGLFFLSYAFSSTEYQNVRSRHTCFPVWTVP
jgi:hypothetical protein